MRVVMWLRSSSWSNEWPAGVVDLSSSTGARKTLSPASPPDKDHPRDLAHDRGLPKSKSSPRICFVHSQLLGLAITIRETRVLITCSEGGRGLLDLRHVLGGFCCGHLSSIHRLHKLVTLHLLLSIRQTQFLAANTPPWTPLHSSYVPDPPNKYLTTAASEGHILYHRRSHFAAYLPHCNHGPRTQQEGQ